MLSWNTAPHVPRVALPVGGAQLDFRAARLLEDVPAKELKGMADALKQQIGSGIVALVARSQERASLVVAVTDDLTARFNAVDAPVIAHPHPQHRIPWPDYPWP